MPIAMMTKETVNRAYETTLSEGVRFERRVFHSMFATQDQKEGMAAFSEKRNPASRTARARLSGSSFEARLRLAPQDDALGFSCALKLGASP